MNLVYTLFGIIAALAGAFFYQKSKKDSAEALLENTETKEKLNEVDKQIAKNDGLLAAEEEKRKQAEEDLKKKEGQDVTKDQLLDWLNKSNK